VIARRWRARASAANAAAYERHLADAVFPRLAAIAGFHGGCLLRRDEGAEVALEVLTFWDSLERLAAFAGADAGAAVVEPAARRLLRRYDRRVELLPMPVAAGALAPAER